MKLFTLPSLLMSFIISTTGHGADGLDTQIIARENSGDNSYKELSLWSPGTHGEQKIALLKGDCDYLYQRKVELETLLSPGGGNLVRTIDERDGDTIGINQVARFGANPAGEIKITDDGWFLYGIKDLYPYDRYFIASCQQRESSLGVLCICEDKDQNSFARLEKKNWDMGNLSTQ